MTDAESRRTHQASVAAVCRSGLLPPGKFSSKFAVDHRNYAGFQINLAAASDQAQQAAQHEPSKSKHHDQSKTKLDQSCRMLSQTFCEGRQRKWIGNQMRTDEPEGHQQEPDCERGAKSEANHGHS